MKHFLILACFCIFAIAGPAVAAQLPDRPDAVASADAHADLSLPGVIAVSPVAGVDIQLSIGCSSDGVIYVNVFAQEPADVQEAWRLRRYCMHVSADAANRESLKRKRYSAHVKQTTDAPAVANTLNLSAIYNC